jgi:hypothetical protein
MSAPGPLQLADLGFPGQMLVWAARQWIRIRDPNARDARRLAEAFERLGAPRALVHLDAVLGLLATRARRSLDFRGPGDLALGEDEHRLLELLESRQPFASAAHPGACAARADGVFDDWVTPSARDDLRRHLDGLAAEFAAAGLRLTCARSSSQSRAQRTPRARGAERPRPRKSMC